MFVIDGTDLSDLTMPFVQIDCSYFTQYGSLANVTVVIDDENGKYMFYIHSRRKWMV